MAVFLGCSGSGRNLGGGGQYCHVRSFEGYEQTGEGTTIVSKYHKAEKLGNPEDILTGATLPAGTYELTIADYMYMRKVDPTNPRRWIMTQIRQDVDSDAMVRYKQETGQDSETLYKSYRYCVGGYRLGDGSYEASMTGITKMVVDQSGKVEFETTSWGYRFDGDKDRVDALWLETEDDGTEKPSWSKPEDSSKYSAPKEVYGENLAVLSLRLLPGEQYQIYTRQDLDGDGTTFQLLRATFKRIPPPEVAPNLEGTETIPAEETAPTEDEKNKTPTGEDAATGSELN